MDILVYANWITLPKVLLIGRLHVDIVRGKEIFSFEYSPEWLKSPQAQLLDPDLQLFGGPQYLSDGKPNFGMFLDSSPDRWGRVLMKRREAIHARRAGRKSRVLYEHDFLLGVFAGTRMGGLRFKIDSSGEFQNEEKALAAPPWVSLRELEYASLQLENDETDETDELRWLNMLMAPGSSLGGARPKASVTDQEQHLWLAKFPSVNDEYDIGGWEMVAYELAKNAGIKVPEAQIQQFSAPHHTFLSKRFDRTSTTGRIHFASAMTLLGQRDGADFTTGVSYLDIVAFIQQNGISLEKNLRELWSRMVFNMLVKNTDDHLRNHGFLLSTEGWELSPAYDMNPNPRGTGLTLNISEDDNSLEAGLALEVAPYFRFKREEAKTRLMEIMKVVSQWRVVANSIGLARKEQEYMADAFEH